MNLFFNKQKTDYKHQHGSPYRLHSILPQIQFIPKHKNCSNLTTKNTITKTSKFQTKTKRATNQTTNSTLAKAKTRTNQISTPYSTTPRPQKQLPQHKRHSLLTLTNTSYVTKHTQLEALSRLSKP